MTVPNVKQRQPKIPVVGANRHREYDRTQRDPESKRFYSSAPWLKIRRMKLNADPLCERCREEGRLVAATIVHHCIEIRDNWDLALDIDNLVSLCHSHHSQIHAQRTEHR
jgi:5-methylcytosine-specific restriction protein A